MFQRKLAELSELRYSKSCKGYSWRRRSSFSPMSIHSTVDVQARVRLKPRAGRPSLRSFSSASSHRPESRTRFAWQQAGWSSTFATGVNGAWRRSRRPLAATATWKFPSPFSFRIGLSRFSSAAAPFSRAVRVARLIAKLAFEKLVPVLNESQRKAAGRQPLSVSRHLSATET